MGLFSTVINRCPAMGPEFISELQTKQFADLMGLFWLAPDGVLYKIDDDDAFDLVDVPEEDRPPGRLSMPFKYVQNGRHGRVRPYRKSGLVRFTTCYRGEYLEAVAHFKTGQLTAVLCKGPMFSCDMVDD